VHGRDAIADDDTTDVLLVRPGPVSAAPPGPHATVHGPTEHVDTSSVRNVDRHDWFGHEHTA
jgi:hypothetical protein